MAIAGVDIYAAAFLTPLGVVLYIAHGGLKASILAAWAHVAIIYACLCLFMFNVYGGGNEDLDSISTVHPAPLPMLRGSSERTTCQLCTGVVARQHNQQCKQWPLTGGCGRMTAGQQHGK